MDVMLGNRHLNQEKSAEHRAELSHEYTHAQVSQLPGFSPLGQGQRLLSVHEQVHHLFRAGRHLLRSKLANIAWPRARHAAKRELRPMRKGHDAVDRLVLPWPRQADGTIHNFQGACPLTQRFSKITLSRIVSMHCQKSLCLKAIS